MSLFWIPCRWLFEANLCSLISSIVSLMVSRFLKSSLSRVIKDKRSFRRSAILFGRVSGSNSPPLVILVHPLELLVRPATLSPIPLSSHPVLIINLSLQLSLPLLDEWLWTWLISSSSSSVAIDPAEDDPFLCTQKENRYVNGVKNVCPSIKTLLYRWVKWLIPYLLQHCWGSHFLFLCWTRFSIW